MTYRFQFSVVKDVLFKNFMLAESEITIGKIVELAIEYYLEKGSYLHLGTVVPNDEFPDIKVKSLYISKGSIAEEYINTQKQLGFCAKETIRSIVEHGLEVDTENSLISLKDYTVTRLELLKKTDASNKVFYTSIQEKRQRTVEKMQETSAKETKSETVKKDVPKAKPMAKRTEGSLDFVSDFTVGNFDPN